jgi:hypothetical protein
VYLLNEAVPAVVVGLVPAVADVDEPPPQAATAAASAKVDATSKKRWRERRTDRITGSFTARVQPPYLNTVSESPKSSIRTERSRVVLPWHPQRTLRIRR